MAFRPGDTITRPDGSTFVFRPARPPSGMIPAGMPRPQNQQRPPINPQVIGNAAQFFPPPPQAQTIPPNMVQGWSNGMPTPPSLPMITGNTPVNQNPFGWSPVPQPKPPLMQPGQLPYMSPNTNQPQPLSIAPPSISAPSKPGPPPQQQQTVADTSGPQIGTVNWNGSLIWNGSGWDANPNNPLAPKPSAQMTGPPATTQAAPPPRWDAWMYDPVYGTPISPPPTAGVTKPNQWIGPPEEVAVTKPTQWLGPPETVTTSQPQQPGFFGSLGSSVAGLIGPQMRQFGNQTSLNPRLTNWLTNV